MLLDERAQLAQNGLRVAECFLGNCLAELGCLGFRLGRAFLVELYHLGINSSLLLDKFLLVVLPELLDVHAVAVTVVVAQVVDCREYPVSGGISREILVVEHLRDFGNFLLVDVILVLEDVRGIGQQIGVIRQINRELRAGHGLPLDGSQCLRHIVADFEYVAFSLTLVADCIVVLGVGVVLRALAAVSQQTERVIGIELAVCVKQHVERTNRYGVRVCAVDVNVVRERLVQVVDALPVADVLTVAEVLSAVGFLNVDLGDFLACRYAGRRNLRGNEEALFLRKRNQVLGRNDVLGVGGVDFVHDDHVRVDRNLVLRHLDRNVLIAGEDFEVPHLVCVADGQRVALAGAVLVKDFCEFFHAVACGVRLHQDNRVERNLAQTAVFVQRVGCFRRLVVVGRNRSADRNALFVHADLAVRDFDDVAVRVGHGFAAVDRVAHDGVAVGVRRIRHGEAVAVLEHRACRMVGRRNDLKHLVVQLADVLGAADIGRAGYGFVRTDVQAAARACADHAACGDGCGKQQCAQTFSKLRIHVYSSFRCFVPLLHEQLP